MHLSQKRLEIERKCIVKNNSITFFNISKILENFQNHKFLLISETVRNRAKQTTSNVLSFVNEDRITFWNILKISIIFQNNLKQKNTRKIKLKET